MAHVYVNVGFIIACQTFFLISACTNPGYLENKSVDFMLMLDAVDSTSLCPDCNTIRTSRSRHCSVCKHCIERFDHHCPWINNCVGVRNHNYFLMYILFQTLLVVTTFSQGVLALTRFLLMQPTTIYNDTFSNFTLFDVKSRWIVLPFVVLLLVITFLFIVPLFVLLYVQIRNFLSGKTTMERFGRVGSDQDRETRIINSGIRGDT